jgi:hypothetical protein
MHTAHGRHLNALTAMNHCGRGHKSSSLGFRIGSMKPCPALSDSGIHRRAYPRRFRRYVATPPARPIGPRRPATLSSRDPPAQYASAKPLVLAVLLHQSRVIRLPWSFRARLPKHWSAARNLTPRPFLPENLHARLASVTAGDPLLKCRRYPGHAPASRPKPRHHRRSAIALLGTVIAPPFCENVLVPKQFRRRHRPSDV